LSSLSSINSYIPDTAPTPEQNYVQKSIEALYSGGHWASIAGQLFEFTGAYYELRTEATEKRRIFDWLSAYSEFVNGKYRCNRANSASVNEVYNSMILAVAIDPNTINPEGLNSSSGVVKSTLMALIPLCHMTPSRFIHMSAASMIPILIRRMAIACWNVWSRRNVKYSCELLPLRST
jgi:hypothetical protein